MSTCIYNHLIFSHDVICSLGSDDISVGGESLAVSGDMELDGEEMNEEEAWLDALESGNVDNTGYLPQQKNIQQLTMRQVLMHTLTQ